MKVKSVDMENGIVRFDGPSASAREVYCRACQERVQIITVGIVKMQGCPRTANGRITMGHDYGCDLELGGEQP